MDLKIMNIFSEICYYPTAVTCIYIDINMKCLNNSYTYMYGALVNCIIVPERDCFQQHIKWFSTSTWLCILMFNTMLRCRLYRLSSSFCFLIFCAVFAVSVSEGRAWPAGVPASSGCITGGQTQPRHILPQAG